MFLGTIVAAFNDEAPFGIAVVAIGGIAIFIAGFAGLNGCGESSIRATGWSGPK